MERVAIEARAAKLTEDDTPEAIGEGVCLDRLLDGVDVLLEDGRRWSGSRLSSQQGQTSSRASERAYTIAPRTSVFTTTATGAEAVSK
jgi:hypothetical protein